MFAEALRDASFGHRVALRRVQAMIRRENLGRPQHRKLITSSAKIRRMLRDRRLGRPARPNPHLETARWMARHLGREVAQ